MAAIRAVLADEHELFSEGIQRILSELKNPVIEVIAAVRSGKDLIGAIEKEKTDLVLFELNFTDVEYDQLIRKIRQVDRDVKLIILSAYGEMKLVRNCFNLGIDGFLLKSNSVIELEKGISEVMQGQVFIGEGLQVAPPNRDEEGEAPEDETRLNDRFLIKQKLTKRETEILQLICAGLNNRQISKELFISDQTVGVHKKNIMKKLKVNSTPDLIRFAMEKKIVAV
jgi:DNA-binding NarL/FixJ family response regulator